MECLIQYLDDIDDCLYAIVLAGERIRLFLRRCLMLLLALVMPVGGLFLALWQPPLAAASASLLLVSLLYRSATTPVRRPIAIG